MKTSRRIAALALGLIMALTMMLGMVTTASAEETITLRFWAHWASEQRRPTIEKIVNMFNEKYADQGIQVEYAAVNYDDIENKLIASVTAGNPPSVVITAIEDVAVKAMRNQAANITEYLSEGISEKFYDKYWEMVQWNGDVYAIPFNTDTRLIYYNKAMFEKAGVSVDDITSWETFQDACVKLDEAMAGEEGYAMAFYPVFGNYGFDTMAINNGSTGIFDSLLDPQEVNLASAENIETLEYMKWFADRYGQELVQATDAASGGGTQDLFLSGKVAMFGHTCNYIATIETYNAEAQVDYGVFAMPAGPSSKTGEPASNGGGFVCTVPYGTEYPAESTLLAEFLATEGAAIWAEEQKDVMCAIEANENPAMSASVGWDEVVALLNNTYGSRNNIYAPKAAEDKNDAVNKIVKTFESDDPAGVLEEAAQKIRNRIEEEKFIFGM